MPLSKCRICGKKVPNLFRPYHEQVACRVMRRRRGEELPKVRKPTKESDEDRVQKKLMEFVRHAETK